MAIWAALPCIAMAQPIGDGPRALPAAHRVGAPETLEPSVRGSLGAGYGYTESVLGSDDVHHRFTGDVAAAVVPVEWLAIALSLEIRHDNHSGSAPNDADTSTVVEPRLTTRGAFSLGDLALGLEAELWLPGSDSASTSLDGLSVALRGLARWSPEHSPLFVGLLAGFHIDRSANTAPLAHLLSDADWLSLGVSQDPAVLLGVAAGVRLDGVELFGEWTWDPWVGDEAPSPEKSPMRLAVGGRFLLTDALFARLTVETLLNDRPPAGAGQRLFRVEPRVSVMLGVSYAFSFATEPAPPPPPPPPPPVEDVRVVEGRIVAPNDEPIVGAHVWVEVDGSRTETESGPDGGFSLEPVPPGRGTLFVEAEGFDAWSSPLAEDAAEAVSVALERALPAGELRLRVRTYQNAPLAATARLEPHGIAIETDASGQYRGQVPPGRYQITVEAEGYRLQRRPVFIEEDGVTVLNIDMRPRGRNP
ncbi:MAG: carboxypeptidase regulatory-like domain-containing protein [Deltaproteobacteria bacterium]|nr:carboxypeptidase regulatory-like domain-containing protein [Deltaproteobacteria bacterium]